MSNFYRLIQGDSLKVLPTLLENSIDCIVSDPPYGLAFMNKSWDRVLPPKEAFAECFRVLKPGALAFIMSSPRQDVLWRMMSMLESVGFKLRQSPIYWTYASGFPKAYDMSKGIDVKFIREAFIKEHNRKPTREELKELVKDKRKVVGRGKGHTGQQVNSHLGNYDDDNYKWKGDFNITEPYSNEAKQWSGWKSQTGLKPAVEVILMVNKPRSEKTIVDNVLKHGTGAVNVDESRIPFDSNDVNLRSEVGLGRTFGGYETEYVHGDLKKRVRTENQKGRFPANLLVSDDMLDTGKIHKSGKMAQHIKGGQYNVYGKHYPRYVETIGDSGGFSRFFSLDAWWRERIKKLPKDIQKTFPFICVPKASKSERNKGLDSLPKKKKHTASGDDHVINEICPYHHKTLCDCGWRSKAVANFHPTVKPLKLMSYLITLGCPPNGTVLDPFLGSGTTMLASRLMNKNCIGIELNPEYCKIAKARCFIKNSLEPNTYNFKIFNGK